MSSRCWGTWDGCFHCLDVTALVGHAREGTRRAWRLAINELNGRSRVARAWLDEDGDVVVGTSLMCGRGVTEAYLAEQIAGWHKSAVDLASSQQGRNAEEAGEGMGRAEGRPRRRAAGGKRGASDVVH